jgi:Na+/H+ antiporter NhaD/arsenite permease-like protein
VKVHFKDAGAVKRRGRCSVGVAALALLAIAMVSNVGSTAAITGNPKNMIIGGLSHISYGTFAGACGRLWSSVSSSRLYWSLSRIAVNSSPASTVTVAGPVRYHRPLVMKSVLVTVAMVNAVFSWTSRLRRWPSAAAHCVAHPEAEARKGL